MCVFGGSADYFDHSLYYEIVCIFIIYISYVGYNCSSPRLDSFAITETYHSFFKEVKEEREVVGFYAKILACGGAQFSVVVYKQT